ncbi:hypothetical protein [Streptomyces uncialis]|uniref:hypothetical protein n=1 Tax=Streptomyces uncialis TaxID=1048205 RepID=UPI0033FE2C47
MESIVRNLLRSIVGALWVSEPTETASKSDGFDQPAGAALGAGRVDDWPCWKGSGLNWKEEEPTNREKSAQYGVIGHQS